MAAATSDKQHRSPNSPALGLRFLLLAGLSILLATVYPLRVVVDAPVSLWRWMKETSAARNDLQLENSRLKAERLLTQARLQKYASLEAENARLRAMLDATVRMRDQVRVAGSCLEHGAESRVFRLERCVSLQSRLGKQPFRVQAAVFELQIIAGGRGVADPAPGGHRRVDNDS